MDWTDTKYSNAMICGSAEAERRTYKKLVGKSGRTWLVAVQPNEADNIYVSGGKNSQGFTGRTLVFKLEDGSTLELQGPWHSNSTSLLADTGYDIRDKYLTFGVIGKQIRYGDYGLSPVTIIDVLHKDKEWVLGEFDRIQKLAQEIANDLGETICCFQKSQGGSSSGTVKPETTEVQSS